MTSCHEGQVDTLSLHHFIELLQKTQSLHRVVEDNVIGNRVVARGELVDDDWALDVRERVLRHKRVLVPQPELQSCK